MPAVESIKALANNVPFVKGRGCNDKSLVFPPLAYNWEHVCINIVMVTNKVMLKEYATHIGMLAVYINISHVVQLVKNMFIQKHTWNLAVNKVV